MRLYLASSRSVWSGVSWLRIMVMPSLAKVRKELGLLVESHSFLEAIEVK